MPDALHPVVAIVQTRMTSSRLPEKVMKPLAGVPLIRRMMERVLRIEGLDRVVVALAEGKVHDPVIGALEDMDVMIVRGSEDDVLSRYAIAARETNAATVMRVTSDCPLIDPEVSGEVLRAYVNGRKSGVRYARTPKDTGYPLGFDTEIFDVQALFQAESGATDRAHREHVTPFIIKNDHNEFPAIEIEGGKDRRNWRLTVDTEADYKLASAIYDALYPRKPAFAYADIVALFNERSDLLAAATGASEKAHAAAG